MPQRKIYLALPLFAASALFAQYPKPAQEPLYGDHTLTQSAPPPQINNNLAAPINKAPQPATTPSTPPLTITMEAPKEGAKSVTGTLEGTPLDKVTGKLQVLDGNVGHQPVDLTIDTTKKTFQATLENALREGQTLRISIFNSDGVLVAFADEPVATLQFDWGRARATFSAGALFVRSNGSFGSADPFLALGVDYNFFNSQGVPTCANRPKFDVYAQRIGAVPATRYSTEQWSALKQASKKDQAPKKDQASIEDQALKEDSVCEERNHGHFLFNTFFEGRLTQVSFPETSGGSGSTPTTSTPAAKANASSGGTGSSSAGTDTTSLINSKTGGQLEAGFYVPKYWSQTRWTQSGVDQAIFLAPIVKGGFYIPGDGEVTPGTAIDGKGVYGYYSGGLRIGHFTLPVDPQSVAPELLSYIDFTWGQFDNFRLPGNTPGTTYVPWRFDSTGRIKIPATQLYLGYEVNKGHGPSDFRVFVGTRFDIGQLLSKLVPSVN